MYKCYLRVLYEWYDVASLGWKQPPEGYHNPRDSRRGRYSVCMPLHPAAVPIWNRRWAIVAEEIVATHTSDCRKLRRILAEVEWNFKYIKRIYRRSVYPPHARFDVLDTEVHRDSDDNCNYLSCITRKVKEAYTKTRAMGWWHDDIRAPKQETWFSNATQLYIQSLRFTDAYNWSSSTY